MSGVADLSLLSDGLVGWATREKPPSALAYTPAVDSTGFEIDIDEVIGVFQQHVGQLNRELSRRSKDLHGLGMRRSRLTLLKRELTRRRQAWSRTYAEQSVELRVHNERLAAERARQDALQAQLDGESAALEEERHRLIAREQELSAESARLAALWESQTAFENARTRLDHDQRRVLDLHKRLEHQQSDLAARHERLQGELRTHEEARVALQADRDSLARDRNDFAAAQARQEGELNSERTRQETERTTLEGLRSRLENDRAELEYTRAALLAEQAGLASERQSIADGSRQVKDERAALSEAQERAQQRETVLRRDEAAFEGRRAALTIEAVTLDERRVGLAHEAERLMLDRRALEDLADRQAAESERLLHEQARLCEAQRELGRQFADYANGQRFSDDQGKERRDPPCLPSDCAAEETDELTRDSDDLPSVSDISVHAASDQHHTVPEAGQAAPPQAYMGHDAPDSDKAGTPHFRNEEAQRRHHNDAEMRLLRRIANRSARAALSSSAQRRLRKSLRWQAPFMAAAFIAAYLSHSICEHLSVGWSHLSTAWAAIGAIAVVIVIQSIVQAWSVPKP